MSSPADLILPHIRSMHAYVPGLQTDDPEVIKLNTNENPFPISDLVKEYINKELASDNLQKYPQPTAAPLRQAIAAKYGRPPTTILAGNGSDEVLSILFRSVLDAHSRVVVANPSYSLYPIIADIVNADCVGVPVKEDWTMDLDKMLQEAGQRNTPLTVITNPNAPTGIAEEKSALLDFARTNPGLTLIDEAYVDFGGESLAFEAGSEDFPRLMTCNTFSKAYSLAGQRVGWMIAHPDIIKELDKIRDSYNLSRLAQTAAIAALNDKDEFTRRIKIIRGIRAMTVQELYELGFSTLKSSTNFIFTRPPDSAATNGKSAAGAYFDYLNQKKIMVRYFPKPRLEDFVRITIGDMDQMDRLLEVTRDFLD